MQVVEINHGAHEPFDHRSTYSKDKGEVKVEECVLTFEIECVCSDSIKASYVNEDIDRESFITATSFLSTHLDAQFPVNKVGCIHCHREAFELAHVNTRIRQADEANDNGPHISSSSSSSSMEAAIDARKMVSKQMELESRSKQPSVRDQTPPQMVMNNTRLGSQQQTQTLSTTAARSSRDRTQEDSTSGMIQPTIKSCSKMIEWSISETTVRSERSLLSPWLPSSIFVAIDDSTAEPSPDQAWLPFSGSISSTTPQPEVVYLRDSPQRLCVVTDTASSVCLPSSQADLVSSTPPPHRSPLMPLSLPFPFPYLPLLTTLDSTVSSPNRMVGSWSGECATAHSAWYANQPLPLDANEENQSGISSTARNDCTVPHAADSLQGPEHADILQSLSDLVYFTGAATFNFLTETIPAIAFDLTRKGASTFAGSLPTQILGFPQALLPQLLRHAADDRNAQDGKSDDSTANSQPVENTSAGTQSLRRSGPKSGTIICAHGTVLHMGAADLLIHDLAPTTGYRHRHSIDADSTEECVASASRLVSDPAPKQLRKSKLEFKVKSKPKSKYLCHRPLQMIPGPEGLDPETRRELEAQGLSSLDLYHGVFDRQRRQWWDPRRYGLKKFVVCNAMRTPRPCTMVLLSVLIGIIALPIALRQ